MPAPKNPNTAPARKAKAQRRKAREAGTIEDVRATLWACIERVDELVQDRAASPDRVLKGTHALTQACSAYVKVIETAELAAQVEELAAYVAEQKAAAAAHQNGTAHPYRTN